MASHLVPAPPDVADCGCLKDCHSTGRQTGSFCLPDSIICAETHTRGMQVPCLPFAGLGVI